MARKKKQSVKQRGGMRRTVPTAEDIQDGITFDAQGRMNYHPEFHPNHRKKMTMDEKIYLAKYYPLIDNARTVAFALGRTEHTIMHITSKLRKTGELDRLRAMSDDEWLEAIEREKVPA